MFGPREGLVVFVRRLTPGLQFHLVFWVWDFQVLEEVPIGPEGT